VREAEAPTLENLEKQKAPCLLWDSDRLRIVWANEAGLELFGAATLFDLLDRPFATSEAGAALVRKLKNDLAPRESRREVFRFPSAGPLAQLAALCSLHRLDDGRQGVLVVGEGSRDKAENNDTLAAEAFLSLPAAALVVSAEGRIEHHNEAAAEYLAHLDLPSTAALLGGDQAASDFAVRVARAGLVSEIRSLTTALGSRDIRLSARKLGQPADGGHRFVLTLEDVTERRALERSLTMRGASAPPAKPMAGPALQAVPPATAEESDIPLIIRRKLDSLDEAIAIVRDRELLFANRHALALFTVPSTAAMRERPAIIHAILDTQGPVAVSLKPGEELCLETRRSAVPWHKGEATQVKFIQRPHDTPVRQDRPPAVADAPDAPVLAPTPAPEEGAPVAASVPVPPAEPVSWKPDDAELSAILDTASDGIITLDAEGRIRSFSAGAQAIFGQPKAMVLGQSFAGLLTPDTQKVFRDYLAALTDSGLAAVFNDGREVSANVGPGRSLPLFLTISKFHVEAKDSEARPAFCAVVRDITQWKQTEAELRDAKEKAEQTSRQKSEFLARISHELRTPLNAILGFSEVMRLERFGKLQNDKYRDYVSDIHSSGAHLLSLINDLLDLSKVEAGKLELNFTSVSLPDVAEHAMRLLADRAQQARVSVRRNFPADLPNVVADLRSMRQIMINLLSNAIKFTDPGGQVMVAGRLNKAGELILRVKDTGVGMNPEELKGALEPFRRITSVTRPDREGTGLGLPLTKALTEANRATFSISSEPGKGTLVEIVYPTTRVLAE
jgi:PAS domain S-box-containing protein